MTVLTCALTIGVLATSSANAAVLAFTERDEWTSALTGGLVVTDPTDYPDAPAPTSCFDLSVIDVTAPVTEGVSDNADGVVDIRLDRENYGESEQEGSVGRISNVGPFRDANVHNGAKTGVQEDSELESFEVLSQIPEPSILSMVSMVVLLCFTGAVDNSVERRRA